MSRVLISMTPIGVSRSAWSSISIRCDTAARAFDHRQRQCRGTSNRVVSAHGMYGCDHPRRAQLGGCGCRSGPRDSLGKPGTATLLANHVRHLRHASVFGEIQKLRTSPHHVVAARRNYRSPRPCPTVLQPSSQRPRRRLDSRDRCGPNPHDHVSRWPHTNHRPTGDSEGSRVTAVDSRQSTVDEDVPLRVEVGW